MDEVTGRSVSRVFANSYFLTIPMFVMLVVNLTLFPLGLFSRRDSWGSPHDPRVQQRDEPRDPRMMRGPGGPPSRPDQNPSNANENKPAIRPLMSLSPPPLPLGQQGFDFDLGLGEDSWKGPPDRRGRKRSLDQEGFRDDRDRGPPKALRPEDEWRRGPGERSSVSQLVLIF